MHFRELIICNRVTKFALQSLPIAIWQKKLLMKRFVISYSGIFLSFLLKHDYIDKIILSIYNVNWIENQSRNSLLVI